MIVVDCYRHYERLLDVCSVSQSTTYRWPWDNAHLHMMIRPSDARMLKTNLLISDYI